MEMIIVKSVTTATEKKRKKSRTNYRVNQHIRRMCACTQARCRVQLFVTLWAGAYQFPLPMVCNNNTFLSLNCRCPFPHYEPQPTYTSVGSPPVLGGADFWTHPGDSSDSDLTLLLSAPVSKVHSCQS